MSIKIDDLQEVEKWEAGKLIPEGIYGVRVIDSQESTSSNGNPQIVLDLEIISGEAKGEKLKDWITITAKSLGRVKGILEALGYQIPAGEFDLNPTVLIGKAAHVTVRHETYQDKKNAKIKFYDPAPEIPVIERAAAPETTRDEDIPF